MCTFYILQCIGKEGWRKGSTGPKKWQDTLQTGSPPHCEKLYYEFKK